jgi:hypothetical protein
LTVKTGRPQWKPSRRDRQLAKVLAAIGTPQPTIANVLGVAPKTLRRHLRHELDHGADEANGEVARSLYLMATAGPPSAVRLGAAQFWLKCRAGWREPVQVEVLKPVSAMSLEEVKARLAMDAPGRLPPNVVAMRS